MQITDTPEATKPKYKESFLKKLSSVFVDLYNVGTFVAFFFKEAFTPPWEVKELLRQLYEIGVRSLALICLTGFIVGLIFTKQSRPSLANFGAQSWIPSLTSIAIFRALAPLVTALITAGRVGSSIGAELGSMRVTEQIDAMEVSGTNPFKFLVTTRVMATSLAVPVLAVFSGMVALFGSYLNVSQNEGTSFATYIDQTFSPLAYIDFVSILLKSLVFGFTIGMVGTYKGYNSSRGTEGVGKAANSAVVTAMFLVFIEEMLLVQIVGWFR